MTGRPSKLTEERQERIIQLIRGGNFASTAAEAAGISESTFYRWMKTGKESAEAIQKWDERVEAWNSLNDAQKRSQAHLRPSEEQQPDIENVIFWEFYELVKSAEAEAEAKAVSLIRDAGEKTWQAAAWYLERKFKDKWGRQDRIDHSGQVNHQIGIGASPAEIEAARARLHAARGELTGEQDPTALPELIEGEAEEIG